MGYRGAALSTRAGGPGRRSGAHRGARGRRELARVAERLTAVVRRVVVARVFSPLGGSLFAFRGVQSQRCTETFLVTIRRIFSSRCGSNREFTHWFRERA